MRCHLQVWNKDARAVSVHVRHASVEVQVQCVNVVIGVVLGELHVVRVVPVVVCDDAVVRRTLVLIAVYRSHCFIVAILRRILLYWRYSVYTMLHTMPPKHQFNLLCFYSSCMIFTFSCTFSPVLAESTGCSALSAASLFLSSTRQLFSANLRCLTTCSWDCQLA